MATYQRVNANRTFMLLIIVLVLILFKFNDAQVIDNKAKIVDRGNAGDDNLRHVERDPNAQSNHGEVPGANEKVKQMGHAPQDSPFYLSQSAECREDIERVCSQSNKDNFDVLKCLLEGTHNDETSVSETCQHFIWNYRNRLTQDPRLYGTAFKLCQTHIKDKCHDVGEKPEGAKILACLAENAHDLQHDKNCAPFVNKMLLVVFGDYKFLNMYYKACTSDIEVLKCGRTGSSVDTKEWELHSEGNTVKCLEEPQNYKKLSPSCKAELLKIAELQADDFHLDRPLYYACKKSSIYFCKDTPSGGGAIFTCLMKSVNDPQMPAPCKELLLNRQRLIDEDVKIDEQFYSACEKDIDLYQCQSKDDLHRSNVILCLEEAHKSGKEVSGECLMQLGIERQEIMENPDINQQLATACEKELAYCSKGVDKATNEDATKVMHCMMDLAEATKMNRPAKAKMTMSEACFKQVKLVLEQVDLADDYRMDKSLLHSCTGDVQTFCSQETDGDSKVLGCLMSNLDHKKMTKRCHDHLHVINFFIVRDFKLDGELRINCHTEAANFCHAQDGFKVTKDTEGPDSEIFVLPCLFKHRKQLTPVCRESVRNLMHQRASEVEMMPQLQVPCITDLSKHCSDKLGKGEELQCLEDNIESLTEHCKKAIEEFVQEEEEDIELDQNLIRECKPVLTKYCQEFMNEEEPDSDDVMDCLIDHKNHPDTSAKCKVQINHHEILMLGDINFSKKLKENCKNDMHQYCSDKKTKYEVIICLSEIVKKDVLEDKELRVSKQCRHLLKAELFEQTHDIDMDPNLKKACQDDLKNHCVDSQDGAEALECLKRNQRKLTTKCSAVLMSHEIANSVMNVMDYAIKSTCKDMIQMYCQDAEATGDVMHCLKRHRDAPKFDRKCKDAIHQQQIVENKDYRLNPDLLKSCRKDIHKHCSDLLKNQKDTETMEGLVITCLKEQSLKGGLTDKCHGLMTEIMEDAAQDYREDASLVKYCSPDISALCAEDVQNAMEGEARYNPEGLVEECLKRNFKKIKNKECQKEVARLFLEGRADVHSDPILYRACESEIRKKCSDVTAGNGQVMSCLMDLLEANKLRPGDCKKTLLDRKNMWEYAAKLVPKSLGDVVGMIHDSPGRTYIYAVLLTILGIILVIGVFCGRVTKRVRQEIKSR